MTYFYKGSTPLDIAEKFIDGYLQKTPIENFVKEIANYHHGVFLCGVESVYLQNHEERYKVYIKDFLERVLEKDKKLRRNEDSWWCSLNSLDFRQAGNLLCRVYKETGDVAYLESIGELVESLETDFPKNSHGGFWHMKSQPNQMWLDGLYMVGPLCVKYAVLSGKRKYGDLALRQAVLMYENMSDEKDGLLYHGWDDSFTAEWADKETGLSAEKWGRALGWFTVAAVEILEVLDDSYEEVDKLKIYVNNIFKALVKVQKETGYWCQVIDKPEESGNWVESSATCLIAYAMAKAVRLGFIGSEYTTNAKKAYEAVVDSLETGEFGELILNKICIGTCIDSGTYEHYINRPTIANDLHGGGAFLLMCGEINRCAM